jgi:hypothetical protein
LAAASLSASGPTVTESVPPLLAVTSDVPSLMYRCVEFAPELIGSSNVSRTVPLTTTSSPVSLKKRMVPLTGISASAGSMVPAVRWTSTTTVSGP